MTITAICCVLLIAFQVFALFIVNEQKAITENLLTLRGLIHKLVAFLFMSVFYYIAVNTYYTLFVQRKPARQHFWVSLAAFLVYAAYSCVTLLMAKQTEKRPEYSTAVLAFSVVISSVFMTGIAFLIAYLTTLRDEQKQRKILEKQKMELEVQNSQANFNFLKAQINPHFLHNTLNFLYSKALPLSAELSEGILCLSDIMRYALSEGNKDEKALLKDEITHLENVIRINQLRFSNNLNVQLEIKGEIGGAMIVPFVLITLVENAFKHGDIRSKEHPIVIRLEVRDKGLYFYCNNKKKTGFKEISTGIGLQNILKRLDIVYGRNYRYTVTDEAEFYTTILIINEL